VRRPPVVSEVARTRGRLGRSAVHATALGHETTDEIHD
jgi:hypothetical protein